MTKQEIFKALENIITINERFSEDDVGDNIEEPLMIAIAEKRFPQCEVVNGASKVCILIQDMPFVIKIPFSHYYCDEEMDYIFEDLIEEGVLEVNENGDIITPEEELDNIRDKYANDCYRQFEGAFNTSLDNEEYPHIVEWDYCALESAYYLEAKKEGLAQYFAAEEYFGTIDNHPIYIQQRAICSYDYQDMMDKDEEKTSKRISSTKARCKEMNICCFNPLWIADFIDLYGEEEFKQLNNFLMEYNIGDLRDSNIGYLNNAPILFDYSGYYDM